MVRRLKLETKLSWTQLVDRPKNAIQQAPHSILQHSPKEVWEGSSLIWLVALSRFKALVDRRNKFKKSQYHYSVVGDQVLIWVSNPKSKYQKR